MVNELTLPNCDHCETFWAKDMATVTICLHSI